MEEYALPGKPVVLTEATKDWKALQWTPESLCDVIGEAMIEVTPSSSLEEALFEMTFAEYVDYLKNPDEQMLYMTSWNFREEFPELLDDFEVPIYFRDDWLQQIDPEQQFDLMWLFLGSAGSGFRMHVDLAQTAAWNCQLTGLKKWLLWSPEQSELVYGGEVDGFSPDFDTYPEFRKAQALEATMGPGDLIFTPSGWWHQTQNLETGLALTANFVNSSNYQRVLKWLEEVGIHLDIGLDMEGYLEEFRRVVTVKTGGEASRAGR